MPYLTRRLELWGQPDDGHATTPDVAGDLASLYFETAQSFAPGTLACLQAMTDDSHIVFGTDYPFMGEAIIAPAREPYQNTAG